MLPTPGYLFSFISCLAVFQSELTNFLLELLSEHAYFCSSFGHVALMALQSAGDEVALKCIDDLLFGFFEGCNGRDFC